MVSDETDPARIGKDRDPDAPGSGRAALPMASQPCCPVRLQQIAMKSEFRSTVPEDAPAIAAFLERIFGFPAGMPLVEPRHLDWKAWQERRDWSGSRGYVMARHGQIDAHAIVVPLCCTDGKQRFRFVHLIDWAADPAAVGSGVSLLKRIAQMVDAVIAVGGSQATQKVLPGLGFKAWGNVTRFARPVRPFRRFATQKFTPRLLAQVARGLLWSAQAASLRPKGWNVAPVRAEELFATGISWPHGAEGAFTFARTAEAMAYFLRCPATPMALYSVMKANRARGYFLLAFAPGHARIADFYIDSVDREDWRILAELAVAQARDNPDVAEVVAMASEPVTCGALLDSGFHVRGSSPLRVLPAKGLALPSGKIRFQMIDSDFAYLHSNEIRYWC